MGPGGNVGQLTEHRPRWTGAHETVQFPCNTMQKRNKAQADTEAREGARAASSDLTDPKDSKSKWGTRGSGSRAPDLVKNLSSESAAHSVSESRTDTVTAAHLDPVTAEPRDRAVETADEPEASRARKFSVGANREKAKPQRESAGEHWSQMGNFCQTTKES